MTGKLFDPSTPNKKTNSREAVEAAIERAKDGEHAAWDIPHKKPSIPHWEANERDPKSK